MSLLAVEHKPGWWVARADGAAFFGTTYLEVWIKYDLWRNANARAAELYNDAKDTEMDSFDGPRRRQREAA